MPIAYKAEKNAGVVKMRIPYVIDNQTRKMTMFYAVVRPNLLMFATTPLAIEAPFLISLSRNKARSQNRTPSRGLRQHNGHALQDPLRQEALRQEQPGVVGIEVAEVAQTLGVRSILLHSYPFYFTISVSDAPVIKTGNIH